MASYVSAFSKKIKGEGGVQYREMDPRKWGNSDFRLAITPVATVQMRNFNADTGEIEWTDLDSFTDVSLAAMLAMDSYLHNVPMEWPAKEDKVIMPPREFEEEVRVKKRQSLKN